MNGAEPLFEISTDKVDAEIPSPAAGVLSDVKVKEGETVPINTVVAVIDETAVKAADDAAKPAPAPAKPAKAAAKSVEPASAPQGDGDSGSNSPQAATDYKMAPQAAPIASASAPQAPSGATARQASAPIAP